MTTFAGCPIFGAPQKFDSTCLPTQENFIKHYSWVQSELRSSSSKEPNTETILKIVLQDIKAIWAKVAIPVISDQRIIKLMKDLYQKYKNIKKPGQSRNTTGYKLKKEEYLSNAKKKLLDIAKCKCLSVTKCICRVKLSTFDHNFLLDQRNTRILNFVDLSPSRKRKLNDLNSTNDSLTSLPSSIDTEDSQIATRQISSISNSLSVSSVDLEDSSDVDESFVYETPSKQMRMDLQNYAKACDRTGVSDRNAAILATSLLEDLGIIYEDQSNNIIDKSKIRRQRQKCRNTLQQNTVNKITLSSLYFDGRKDRTLINEQIEGKFHRKIASEEHIVLISEPNSDYLGHVTPASGAAENIKDSIINFIKKKYSKLRVIGSDGANVNTGEKNGVIVRIERSLGWSVHWFICLFHLNELPLRHLILSLDGVTVTAGPNQWTGSIGKALKTCETNPIVEFEKILLDMPLITTQDLSKDQKYLYEISVAISNGVLPANLAHCNPGNLCHSRWLTTANRILRLYVSKKKPTKNLKTLATFIIKVYVPTWFAIKLHPSCIYGSKHLFDIIRRSRYLEKSLRNIIDAVIQRNGYFAHPENILLAMLGDERKLVREQAVNTIMESRLKNNSTKKLRSFNVPTLNMSAKDYVDLIDWKKIVITEPPLTRDLEEHNLRLVIENGLGYDITGHPCHNQAVERSVKLVTEASSKVCNSTSRDGFIRTTLESRRELPKFDTKKEYTVKLGATNNNSNVID